jgi:hypothetical protein
VGREPGHGRVPEVMSDVPGRLRFRLPPAADGPELERRLREADGVIDCRWTPRTRSLLVTYRPDQATRSALMALGPFAGDAATTSAAAASPEPGRPRNLGRTRSALVRAVAGAAAEADAAVSRLTSGVIDLRTGLPLALGLWAAREILRGNARPVAWSTALWYAHALLREYALPADQDGA